MATLLNEPRIGKAPEAVPLKPGHALPPQARRLLEGPVLPTLLGMWNWGTQWATYHLVLEATHLPVSVAASFTALIAANLSGLLRPTPANVGVVQAALVVALLPFGVAPEQAVAAGLALQGLQVLPVLLLGAMVTGWRLLRVKRELEEAA